MWVRILQHLLPRGRAWSITVDKKLRQWLTGLVAHFEDVKTFADNAYLDFFAQTTRKLDLWEEQKGLRAANLTEQERRDRLAARWKALGGQDPDYIQTTLQNTGFNVYVHEWWVPGALHPAGGQVNGDEPPVARNPYTYLYDGVSADATLGDGHDNALDGFTTFQDGNDTNPIGYLMVNKVLEPLSTTIGDGHDAAYDGGDLMADGAFTLAFVRKLYQLTATADEYPFFIYIGAESFPDTATVPANRRDEFEDLILSLCPLEQWVGMLVQYT